MRYKLLIIQGFLILFNVHLLANNPNTQGYKIQIDAPFKRGSMAYFAHYWAGKPYVSDSLQIPDNGRIVFEGEEKLQTGQYLLYIDPGVQLELLISGDQQDDIKIKLSEKDLSKSKVSGSRDTKLFWEYLKGLDKLQYKQNEILEELQKSTGDNRDKLLGSYKATVISIDNYIDSYIENNKNSWFSSVVKLSKEIREPHVIPLNKEEQTANRIYLQEHFFDNIDLKDDRLWRTSIFVPKINLYLTELTSQNPDSLAFKCTWIVAQTLGNDFCFENMLSLLVNQATTSKSMGMENVWTKLAEEYIFDKNIAWIDSVQYNELRKEYSLIEHNRIGMIAQNLEMQTLGGDTINTANINANLLILYFYSPNCSFCEREIPLLRDQLYPKYKDQGLKIVAINTDSDITHWSGYVQKYNMSDWINLADPQYKSEYWLKYDVSGTPSLYLLNKNKVIVAKKLDINNLEIYLENIKDYN